MSKHIYLSPSMQKANIYATGNTNEMVQCNRIAESAKTALLRCGFDVKKAPEGQSMNDNIKESNNWKSDLHLALHSNAYNGKTTGGTLVFIYSNASENMKAGTAILNAVAPISPGPDYSIQLNSSLAELNSTKAVAVYLECELHDTPTGATWIINNVKEIGESVAKGVCDYYGVTYKPENSTPQPTPAGKIYKVQVGAFKDLNNAKTCRDDAIKKGFDGAFIV